MALKEDYSRSSAGPVTLDERVSQTTRVRLDKLGPHQCGTICHVDTTDGAAGQLMAMGVCAGRRIEVIQRGDPMILRVLGSRLGVSAPLASRVKVELCLADQCHLPSD